jgi:uncharacterized protein
MPKREAPELDMMNCRLNSQLQFKECVDKEANGHLENMTLAFEKKIGNGIKASMLILLKIYKICISPLFPRACRFEPTCSVYMYQAIKRKGILKGLLLGIKRLLRCHPFCEGGFDPVP